MKSLNYVKLTTSWSLQSHHKRHWVIFKRKSPHDKISYCILSAIVDLCKMKLQAFASLSWLTLEAGAAIVPRQSKPPVPSDFEVVAPNVKPARIIDLPSAARSGSTRKILRYGPFTIPAAKVRWCKLVVTHCLLAVLCSFLLLPVSLIST